MNQWAKVALIGVILAAAGIYVGVLEGHRDQTLQERKEVKLIQDRAIDFELENWEGEKVRFSQLNSNKFVLVNFWATWCEPCVREIPAMIRLRKKLEEKPFEIVLVNIGEDWPKIKKFFKRFGGKPAFVSLLDKEEETPGPWGTSKLPETYWVAPGGKILDKYIGFKEFDSEKTIKEFTETMDQFSKVSYKQPTH